jgi:hypothetical protein
MKRLDKCHQDHDFMECFKSWFSSLQLVISGLKMVDRAQFQVFPSLKEEITLCIRICSSFL